ncbi:hypothetical protein NPIL_165971 [Nephila pilipes]|uniref:Uncharacterized protein n=1 Tax=Nephila pilipes TaxID=299642 RepID=A0A8X6UU00_NEPPI|nr:hypothetical protein NPIL_165971 [Nephila pilipes]
MVRLNPPSGLVGASIDLGYEIGIRRRALALPRSCSFLLTHCRAFGRSVNIPAFLYTSASSFEIQGSEDMQPPFRMHIT